MPWCEACARFLTPTALAADGSCPSCGRRIATGAAPRAPWHFKVLVGATALYLLWRGVQLVGWLLP